MLHAVRKLSLTQWIMIAMVLGILLGWVWPEGAQELKVVSNVFLRLIRCLLVPLVFSTLVVGIAGHGDDLKAVGRLALRSIIYFEVVTTLALAVGLVAVNLAQPGQGVALPPAEGGKDITPQQVTWQGIVEHIFPRSFFEAAAQNDVLQVVCFAMLFAAALSQVRGQPHDTMVAFCESLMEIMFKFVGIVMKFAPFGVGAAIAYTVSHSGVGVLLNLGKLIVTLYAALAAFSLLVLLPVMWWARIPVAGFVRAVWEPALLAFSTTSSDAAMPDAMKRMMAFGVPKRIVSFVMPLGYSFNLDGSTLYLAVVAVFVAQAAGVPMTPAQQLTMMLTLMLTSKGVAGVPRAAPVILAGTLVTFNLPLEGVVLIMGVDSIMDMGRTTINLVGNCLATAVMARWEGELGVKKM